MKTFFAKAAIILKGINCYLNANYGRQRKLAIGYRIVLVLLALSISIVYLRKIYEVPVYYTEFQVFHEGTMTEGDLHLFLTRDYDRQKEASEYSLVSNSTYKGGIRLEGTFWNKGENKLSHSDRVIDDSIKNKILSEILDTTIFEDKRNVDNMVYIKIKTTQRQIVRAYKTENSHYEIVLNDNYIERTAYYQHGFNDTKELKNKFLHGSYWEIPADTILAFYKYMQNDAGYGFESFHFSSKSDSALPIMVNAAGTCFEKPNPFLVAEDVSKLFEKIKIPRFTSIFINSITIDYKCPTEFGYLSPEPDEMTYSSIRYYNRDKIDQIAHNGLKYHVKFPDMENIQEIRIFGLTTIVTLLVTFLLSLIYKLFTNTFTKLWIKYKLAFFVILIFFASLTITYIIILEKQTKIDYKELNFEK